VNQPSFVRIQPLLWMNAQPGLPSGTATNVAPFGKATAIRALPKLNEGRPGTGCDDVFDTRQGAAAGESRTETFSGDPERSGAPASANIAIAITDD
jgi:hypothetical protein